jgi:hypothetical protein
MSWRVPMPPLAMTGTVYGRARSGQELEIGA